MNHEQLELPIRKMAIGAVEISQTKSRVEEERSSGGGVCQLKHR